MEVEFRLTPEDIIALQRYHKKHPPIPRKPQQNPLQPLVWVVVFLVVFGAILLFSILHNPLIDTMYSLLPGVLVGLVLGHVVQLVTVKLATRNATQRSLEQGRNAEKVLGWRRISIDARAIRVETEYSALTYLWWGVDAITASEDHAFIYFMTNNAFIIPREAFRTDRAFDEFVEAARRYHGMAGVGAAVREVIGESDRRERPRPAGVQSPAAPGEPKAEEGIVARTPDGEQREGNP